MIDINLIQFTSELPTKESVFEQLATIIYENGYGTDTTAIKKALFTREEEGTTGMMDGFAIPHAKSSAIIKPCVAILKLPTGVEWQSMDGKLISSVIALFIPDSEAGTTHLQYLSKIARLLMKEDFKHQFQDANTPEEVAKVFSTF